MLQPSDQRRPAEYKAEVLRLYHTNPVVYASLSSHHRGTMTYEQALECMVVILAEQNATLMERCVRLTSGAQTVIHMDGKELKSQP